MDVERTMQFILDQQAQFASDLQELKQEMRSGFTQVLELITNLAVAQARTDEIVSKLAERVVELTERQAELTERQAELTDRQAELTDRQAELTERQAELTDQQKTVEQQLAALIAVVDRHIADHR